MLDDEKDYSEFLAGDNAGFERLVIRYKDGLIYYVNKIIKNITIAEDLAQRFRKDRRHSPCRRSQMR